MFLIEGNWTQKEEGGYKSTDEKNKGKHLSITKYAAAQASHDRRLPGALPRCAELKAELGVHAVQGSSPVWWEHVNVK